MIVPVLWIAAFFFSLPLVQPYEVARLLAFACAGGAAAIALAQGGVLPRSRLLAAGGLFWLLAAASVMWSAAPYVSFISFCTFSLMPLSALAFLAAPQGGAALRVAGAGAMVILAALALNALAQYLFLPGMLVYGQVRWPFANPNSYAALLAAGGIVTLGAAAGAQGWRRAAALLAAGLMLAAVIVIGGRAVPFVLAAALVAFCVLARRAGALRRDVIITALAAAGAGFAVALLGAGGTDAPIARIAAGTAGEAAFFGRLPIWQGAFDIIRDHAWTGTGIGTFFLHYPAHRLVADRYSGGYMAHSDPLQFWAELGTAGPLLFYGFIALALWRMRGARHGVAGAAAFCALGVLAVHSHVDFNFYVAAILCFSGFLLARWHRETAPAAEAAMAIRPRYGAAVAVTAALILLQGLLLSEWQVDRARALALAGDMDGFGAMVNAADRTGFGLNARPYVLAAVVPLGLLEAGGAGMDEAGRDRLHGQIGGLLDEAAARNPRLAAVPYYRARLSALHRPENTPAAEDFLRAALAINPQHLPSRLMLAQRLKDAGAVDEAYGVMRDGMMRAYPGSTAQEYFETLGARALLRGDMQAYGIAAARLREMESAQPVTSAPEVGQGDAAP